MGGWVGGGGGGVEMNSSSKRSRPVKTEETISQARTTMKSGDPASEKQFVCFAHCCFNSCEEQSQLKTVRKAAVEDELCSKTNHPAMSGQLHLDPFLVSRPGLSVMFSPLLSCCFTSSPMLRGFL